MGMKWIALLALFLGASHVALAVQPPGQGRRCRRAADCAAPLTCVSSGERKSCEIACDLARPKCPEDQRCVKDGGAQICRPILDGIALDADW